MKKLLTSLTILAFILACGSSSERSGGATTSTATADKPAIDGEKIYKTYCVTCHGLYGDMGASGAHDLTKSELNLEERIAVITNGRNTMTPFKDLLNEDKIKAVAEHTMTLKKQE